MSAEPATRRPPASLSRWPQQAAVDDDQLGNGARRHTGRLTDEWVSGMSRPRPARSLSSNDQRRAAGAGPLTCASGPPPTRALRRPGDFPGEHPIGVGGSPLWVCELHVSTFYEVRPFRQCATTFPSQASERHYRWHTRTTTPCVRRSTSRSPTCGAAAPAYRTRVPGSSAMVPMVRVLETRARTAASWLATVARAPTVTRPIATAATVATAVSSATAATAVRGSISPTAGAAPRIPVPVATAATAVPGSISPTAGAAPRIPVPVATAATAAMPGLSGTVVLVATVAECGNSPWITGW